MQRVAGASGKEVMYGIGAACAGGGGLRQAVFNLALASQEDRLQRVAGASGKEVMYGIGAACAGGGGLRQAVFNLALASQEYRLQRVAGASGKEVMYVGKPLLGGAGCPCPKRDKSGTADDGFRPFHRRRRNWNYRRGRGNTRAVATTAVQSGARSEERCCRGAQTHSAQGAEHTPA
jgi:hypothetical protein